ncbi:hypothetical protein LPJ66_008794, partial [Kickxella alabastrina]
MTIVNDIRSTTGSNGGDGGGGSDSSSSSRPHSRLSFGDDDNNTEVIDAALDRAKEAEDEEEHHPYLSRRSMSKNSFEAGHMFVNAMFDKHPSTSADGGSWAGSPGDGYLSLNSTLGKGSPQVDPMTPRSILMSQKLHQAHADA